MRINKNFIKALELDKNKKYLFLIDLERTGLTRENLSEFDSMLTDFGFKAIGLVVNDIKGVRIIEQKK